LTVAITRIAMWSGPRNISTALMRAFENRDDCAVVDEPLYGFYLQRTGLEHPGRERIIAAMDCDWRSVTRALCEQTPPGIAGSGLYYQKHMTQHLLPEVDLAFTDTLVNCFLIREPRRIIASYARVRPRFTLEELGLPQQLALFRRVVEREGQPPPVIDATATLMDPEGTLRALCARIGIAFSERMLRWPRGGRSSDGVWAPYWYSAVVESTGWEEAPAQGDGPVEMPAAYEAMCAEAESAYAELSRHVLVS
jgi:hypothetical protein